MQKIPLSYYDALLLIFPTYWSVFLQNLLRHVRQSGLCPVCSYPFLLLVISALYHSSHLCFISSSSSRSLSVSYPWSAAVVLFNIHIEAAVLITEGTVQKMGSASNRAKHLFTASNNAVCCFVCFNTVVSVILHCLRSNWNILQTVNL